jgi:short-subunit dehydrogenase
MSGVKNIDILVNCAGVAHYSPLVVTTSASMEQTLQTNLMGTMLGCKIVGKRMIANREGETKEHFDLFGEAD